MELCRELDRRGVEILLASMGTSPSREQIASDYLSVYRMASSPQRKPLHFASKGWDHYTAMPVADRSG